MKSYFWIIQCNTHILLLFFIATEYYNFFDIRIQESIENRIPK